MTSRTRQIPDRAVAIFIGLIEEPEQSRGASGGIDRARGAVLLSRHFTGLDHSPDSAGDAFTDVAALRIWHLRENGCHQQCGGFLDHNLLWCGSADHAKRILRFRGQFPKWQQATCCAFVKSVLTGHVFSFAFTVFGLEGDRPISRITEKIGEGAQGDLRPGP